MENNNLMARLCGFIVSAMLTFVVVMTTWNFGLVYERRIQVVALMITVAWLVSLTRAKGWKEYKVSSLIASIVLFGSLGLFLGYAWHCGYITNAPLIGINAETDGISRDTLYHNAIASSIEYYGYPSLLVNSDAFHNYHFGSHLILGLLSRLMNMPTIFTYCYLYPVIFFSAYPSLILSVGHDIRKWRGLSEKINPIDIIVLLGFITYYILPQAWSESLGSWKTSWLISESFCVAIALCLLFFKTLFLFEKQGLFKKLEVRILFAILVVPVFIFLTGLAKISVGLILTFAISYYLFRKYGFKPKFLALEFFYVAVIMMVHYIPSRIYSPILSGTTEGVYSISLLAHLKSNISIRLWGLHILLFFLYAIIFVAYGLRKKGTLKDLINGFKNGEFIIEETMAVLCIVGSLPGMFIDIGGGSAFYFVAIQQVFATTLLIGFNIPQSILSTINLKKSYIYQFASVFVLICLLFDFCVSAGYYALTLKQDCSLASVQYEESVKENSYWDNINKINTLTEGHKSDYYIYVCDSANVWTKYSNPDSALFFYPAFTGIVCIGELYFEDGVLYTNNGVPKDGGYTYRPLVQDEKMTEYDALAKAVEDGKKAVIYLHDNTFTVKETGI